MPDHLIDTIVVSDALEFLKALPDESVQLFLFSPPYNLGVSPGGGIRSNSGHLGKWHGMELANGYDGSDDSMPMDAYITWQHQIIEECWRLLPDNGAIYYNHKPRCWNGQMLDAQAYVPKQLTIRHDTVVAPSQPVPTVDHSEENYYRGIYDICRVAASPSSDECLKFVDQAHSSQWFEKDSDGWVWK